MHTWSSVDDSLWQTGQRIALAMLRGDEHVQEREDIVATAIAQTVTDHLEKNRHARNAPPPSGDLEGMMKTIVRRRLLDHLRQRYRRTIVPLDDSTPLPVQELTPEDAALAAELWQTIAELDPPLPDLFTDRFLHGWTTSEIAERRGMKLNTVLSHFRRGFGKLRVVLTQRHEGTKKRTIKPSCLCAFV